MKGHHQLYSPPAAGQAMVVDGLEDPRVVLRTRTIGRLSRNSEDSLRNDWLIGARVDERPLPTGSHTRSIVEELA